jgi:SNF2 family DNA or RNA helicase
LSTVFVELNESVDRIEVHFKYDERDVAAVKTIPGRRFDWDRKINTVPMNLKAARRLREIFGDRMTLGPAVKLWAKDQIKQEKQRAQLQNASDAKLERVPKVIEQIIAGRPIGHPTIPPGHVLRRRRKPRPYQRADIKMMSLSSSINANDVGTGKTLEAIGAIYEADIYPRPILIVAPKRSLENVWQTEFHRLTDYEVFTSESPAERGRLIEKFLKRSPTRRVLCLIADDLRVDKYYDIKDVKPTETDPLHAGRDYKGNWYRFRSETQAALFDIKWGAFIVDEFHTMGLPNRKSLFHIAAQLVRADYRWPMSGTPIGGKPRRFWPLLNFIDAKAYSSEWRWIDEWLVVDEEKVYRRGGGGATINVKKVGGIKPGLEEDFYNEHRTHMVRRTKKDALPGIPDAIEIIVPTPMAGRQLREYKRFDDDHEIVLDDKRLSGGIVLTQYLRLRQMANARLEWNKLGKPVASKDSCKLEHLFERLDEHGIWKGSADTPYEPGARAYIGVLEVGFMEVIAQELTRKGIDNATLHGGTKDSKPILDRFAGDDERPFVIVMTIQTGGTALNLERANSAHMLDEPWDPDQQHQFFGRGDRGARETALKCYIYRTPNSIQEYVAQVAGDKKITNRNILNYAKEIEALRHAK